MVRRQTEGCVHRADESTRFDPLDALNGNERTMGLSFSLQRCAELQVGIWTALTLGRNEGDGESGPSIVFLFFPREDYFFIALFFPKSPMDF